ncbi:MAG: universal stress protein [Flavobacteriaceae bacterium]
MKKIIVPVDFSQHSEFALKAAALLAKKEKAEIYVLHMLDMIDNSVNESLNYQYEKTVFLLKLAEKKFKAFLDKDYLKGITVNPIIKHFKVFSEVNEIAKEENADLIIMGSHGASGLKEFFVGSNTEKVIRFSDIPVLVIKNELTDLAFDNIVFPTDFSDELVNTYVQAKQVVKTFNGKLHLLYVNTPYDNFKTSAEMENMCVNFLNKAEGNSNMLNEINFISDRTIEKGILNFSNSVGADLIAISTHGRKGLSHVFKGSLSEDIANHSSLPILTFKM